MPYRPDKKRAPITPQIAESVNEDCIAHGGDPDALRFKFGMTRRQALAFIISSQAVLIRELRKEIQGAARKPAQSQRNGGFAA